MTTRAEAQFAAVLQVVDAAVVLDAVDSDDAGELDDLLQPGVNLRLLRVGRAAGRLVAGDARNLHDAPAPGGSAVLLQGDCAAGDDKRGWRQTRKQRCD